MKQDLTVHDACYVALAQRTSTRVITGDRELLNKFPADAIAISEFEVTGRR